MKVEIPKELVSDLVDELADTREAVKDKDKEKWDRTPSVCSTRFSLKPDLLDLAELRLPGSRA